MKNGKKSEYIPIYFIKYHENWYLCALEVNELIEMKIKHARVMNNQWDLWKMKRIWNITLCIPLEVSYQIEIKTHYFWILKNGTVFAVASAITLKNRFCIIYLLILHV